MAHEKIEQARISYKKGEIEFMELHNIFFEFASDSEKQEFWDAPTFDRAWVIEGKSKSQRDSAWNALVKSWK